MNPRLIDWIRLQNAQLHESTHDWSVRASKAVHVFFKEGVYFRPLAFHVDHAEGDTDPTNFARLESTGELSLFEVRSGPDEIHVFNTERIALIELPLALLGVGKAVAEPAADRHVKTPIDQMPILF